MCIYDNSLKQPGCEISLLYFRLLQCSVISMYTILLDWNEICTLRGDNTIAQCSFTQSFFFFPNKKVKFLLICQYQNICRPIRKAVVFCVVILYYFHIQLLM